jgi:hypothetical protein
MKEDEWQKHPVNCSIVNHRHRADQGQCLTVPCFTCGEADPITESRYGYKGNFYCSVCWQRLNETLFNQE